MKYTSYRRIYLRRETNPLHFKALYRCSVLFRQLKNKTPT